MILGVYTITDNVELGKVIQGVNGDWSAVHSVAVGNEIVNRGVMDGNTFAGIINDFRNQLRGAGFQGPVVGIDTFNQILSNPAICQASDYVAANCHPFFDPNTSPDKAGDYVKNMSVQMGKACGGKNVLITETGWPHQGDPNGQAQPGMDQQKMAIKSIYSAMGSNVILFDSFDSAWKQDSPATFNAEKVSCPPFFPA